MNDETKEHDSEPGGSFADIETPEELKPHATPDYQPKPEPVLPPALERERPVRPPLVPHWFWLTLAVIGLGLLLLAGFFVWQATSGRVDVPDVVGLDVTIARTRISQAGLDTAIIEERFSSEPQGEVLEQRPRAGTALKTGETVGLIVSAGTEEFVMPDVIGDGIALARGTLEARGLVIEIEPVTSDQASNTVLATTPAPGVLVRIGDTVRVQVASPRPESTNLRPYRLQGLAVTIDPALSPEQDSDVPVDVARRLRALLEASGATVVVLRSGTSTATSDADRAEAAAESSATIAIGLSVRQAGPAGRSVVAPDRSGSPSPGQLRDAIAAQFAAVSPPSAVGTATNDPVLGRLSVPWARVTLGSYSSRADETSFADPRWVDEVARAIYVGIGEVYGTKEGL